MPRNAGQTTVKSLKQALDEIEARYHVFFIYESQLVDEKMIAADSHKSNKLEETLKGLLQPLDLKFEKVKDNVYVIVLSESNKRSLKEIKRKLTASLDPTIEADQTGFESAAW